jgi:hypothetical protein
LKTFQQLNGSMDFCYPLTLKCVEFCHWLYCWNWITEFNSLFKAPSSTKEFINAVVIASVSPSKWVSCSARDK